MHHPVPTTPWVAVVLTGFLLLLGLQPAVAQSSNPNQAAAASQTLAVSPEGLISRTSSGARADEVGATGGSVSADGEVVAFESASDSLDRSDSGNGFSDVFVRDRKQRITADASRAFDGGDSDGHSYDARLSGNGRFVAFTSEASNLIRNDRNDVADVFVHDLETGVTRLASIDDRGRQLDIASRLVDISDDGTTVLLATAPSNTDVGESSANVVTLQAVDWVVENVEVVGEALGAIDGLVQPSASLSGPGHIVAFVAGEPLDDNDDSENENEDDGIGDSADVAVFVKGLRESGDAGLRRVSGAAEVGDDVLLADGGNIVFFVESSAGDGWSLVRVDLRDDSREIVSIGDDGEPMGGLSKGLTFGANRSGSSVAWSTDAPAGDDRNQQSDVFQRSFDDGVTYRVSVERHGFELVGPSMLTATMRSISDDAKVVAFTSTSAELVPNDTNRASDVFVATPASTCNDEFITVFLAAGELPTERDDVILGSRRGDSIDAGNGNDVICAGDGNDVILGGGGSDLIFGEGGNDIIEGGDQRDAIDGGPGNDKLYGDDDRDQLIGGNGADLLVGGNGRDRLLGGYGVDRLLGEKGADHLDGGPGNDELLGGASRDKLLGRNGDDILKGGGGNDTLKAGAGSDDLDGGDGNDRVNGGPGSDRCRPDPELQDRRSSCERS